MPSSREFEVYSYALRSDRLRDPDKVLMEQAPQKIEEEGVLKVFQAKAIEEVIAGQLAGAMPECKLSKNKLAVMIQTSRTQVNRVLDPNDGNVTI